MQYRDPDQDVYGAKVVIGPIIAKAYAVLMAVKIVNLFAAIMLFVALCRQSHFFLVPKLIMQVSQLLLIRERFISLCSIRPVLVIATYSLAVIAWLNW